MKPKRVDEIRQKKKEKDEYKSSPNELTQRELDIINDKANEER